MVDDLIIGMAGSGGDGIVSAGESLISAAAAEGYFAILTKSFGTTNSITLVKATFEALGSTT